MIKISLITGTVLFFFAIAFGAFGAHALAELLQNNDRADVYELANRYQFYHGVALITLGLVSYCLNVNLKKIFILMLMGVLIFSGSLYALALTNLPWFGAITPVGGVLLLLAWALFIRQIWLLDVA